ncbi:mechanosensitive ion channel [Kriegella sp. EG-1]|nr:mechanosensitive ion channel [Flavobacteriaceae bacterium EG-1]
MQEFFDFFKQPMAMKIATLVIWIAIILILIGLVRKFFKRRIDDTTIRYKAQKAVEIIGYILIFLVVIFSFTIDDVTDYTIIIGLFTAGLTFTLQELILSIAGSFYIFLVRVYKPGDRIEINGIKGDVIDIDSIYTTIMEMGEWVNSDNYSGRIVKISNAFVFKGPIKNYSMDFPFVWDELNVVITYDSNIELAKKIVYDIANEQLSEYAKDSTTKWREMVERYYIENAAIEPTIALRLTDNWIELNLRYITDYKKRRATKHQLFESIAQAITNTNKDVHFASTTLQLLKIPEVEISLKNQSS